MPAIPLSSALHFPLLLRTHYPLSLFSLCILMSNTQPVRKFTNLTSVIWLILASVWGSTWKCCSQICCVVFKTRALQIYYFFPRQHVCVSFDLLFLICIAEIWCSLANERLHAPLVGAQTELGHSHNSLPCHPSALSLLPCLYNTFSCLATWARGSGALFQIRGNFLLIHLQWDNVMLCFLCLCFLDHTMSSAVVVSAVSLKIHSETGRAIADIILGPCCQHEVISAPHRGVCFCVLIGVCVWCCSLLGVCVLWLMNFSCSAIKMK